MGSPWVSCLEAMPGAALIFLAAWAAGKPAPARMAGLRLPLGLGVLGTVLFGVGLARWNLVAVAAVVLPLAGWGVWDLATSGRARWRWHPAILAITPLLGWLALAALALPTGDTGNDAVGYHLAAVRHWMLTGRITPMAGNFPTAYPGLIETLYGAAMELGNARSAGLVALGLALVLLRQVWLLSEELGGENWGRAARGWAVALAACMPLVMGAAPMAFADIGLAVMVIAGSRAAAQADGIGEWIGAGALLGLGAAVKYTGLMTAAIALVVAAVTRRIGKRAWLAAAAGAAACGAPWYLRNAWLYGAPIYPLPSWLAAHWPWGYHDPGAAAFEAFMRARDVGFGGGWGHLLLAPIQLTYWPGRFNAAGGIGVAPLALAPLAVGALWRSERGRYWLLWLGAMIGGWFFTFREGRYFDPIAAVLAAMAALGAVACWRKDKAVGAAAAAAVGLSLAYGGAVVAWEGGAIPRAVASLRSAGAEQRYWEANVPYAGAFAFLNGEGSRGRVLVLDPLAPVYYLDRDFVYARTPDAAWGGPPPLPDLKTAAAGEDIAAVLDTDSGRPGYGFALAPNNGLPLLFDSPRARVYAWPH